LDGKYWEWELFLDTDRTVHKALGLVKYGIVAGLADLVTSASRKAVSAALKLGIKGNFDGDGFQLGGTFVVGPGNTGLLYEYRQTVTILMMCYYIFILNIIC
jgi:prostamide/prostaglandin F2alpha synthase